MKNTLEPDQIFDFNDGNTNIKIELYEPCNEATSYLFTLESDDESLEKAYVVLNKHQMKALLESVAKSME